MLNLNTLIFNDFIYTLKPMVFFVLGLILYSVFIFKFYKFIGRKDIFNFDLDKYNLSEHKLLKLFFAILIYILKYLILFPLFVFLWFLVFGSFLVFFSELNIEYILLISMSLIATIRIISYFSEDLSKEIAKLLPFSLLAIFLISMNFNPLSYSLDIFYKLLSYWNLIFYYFLFIIFFELILRCFDFLRNLYLIGKNKDLNNIKKDI